MICDIFESSNLKIILSLLLGMETKLVFPVGMFTNLWSFQGQIGKNITCIKLHVVLAMVEKSSKHMPVNTFIFLATSLYFFSLFMWLTHLAHAQTYSVCWSNSLFSPELYDVVIVSEDGTELNCHKCILVARLGMSMYSTYFIFDLIAKLQSFSYWTFMFYRSFFAEYFRSMLASGWLEVKALAIIILYSYYSDLKARAI